MVKNLVGTTALGLLLATNVFAASLSLVQTTTVELDQVQIADVVTLDVVIDFTGDPALGGGFNIDYDSSAVLLVGFVRNAAVGDPDFSRDPDNLPDLLESWAVGDFQGVPETATLGNVTFQVLPGIVTDTVISISPTSGIGGPWVSGKDFLTIIPASYNQVLVSYDTDGDGDPNASDLDDDNDGVDDVDEVGGLDPLDPDSDDDGIGDALDTDLLTDNNGCTGGDDINATLGISVVEDLICAARISIDVQPATQVLTDGHLTLITPSTKFQSGFRMFDGGKLTVTSVDPCPGCSP